MFYYLKGIAAIINESFVVLDIGGAGYKVFTSVNSRAKIEKGKETLLYTYTNIREDAFDIYGFTTEDELTFFEKMIGVSGVGPKAALAILSVLTPSEIVTAILTNDARTISRAQGVGVKLAQRVILELSGKIDGSDLLSGTASGGDDYITSNSSNDAVAALIALGYSSLDARRAVASVEPGKTVEATITDALLFLSRN